MNAVNLGRRRLIRWASWGVADQAFSSLTNFAVAFLVARRSDPAEFGAFGIAFSVYVLCLGVSRTVAAYPLLIRFTTEGRESWARAVEAACGAAVVVAILLSLLILAGAYIASGPLRASLVLVGLGMPALLLQDTWRYVAFSASRPQSAFLNDFLWAVVLFSSFAILEASGTGTMARILGAWILSASVAALVGFRQFRVMPGVRLSTSWVGRHGDLMRPLISEFAAAIAGQQLAPVIVGSIAGLDAVAALRGALLILGPLNILFMGVAMAFISAGTHLLQSSVRRFVVWMRLIAVSLSALAGAWAAVTLLIPDRVGRGLLGANWSVAHVVLLPIGVFTVAVGATIGARIGLKSIGAATRSFRAEAMTSGLTLIAAGVGVFAGDVVGAAWGMAGAQIVSAGYWQWHFARAMSELELSKEGSLKGPILEIPREAGIA